MYRNKVPWSVLPADDKTKKAIPECYITSLKNSLNHYIGRWLYGFHRGVDQFVVKDVIDRLNKLETGWESFVLGLVGNTVWAAAAFTSGLPAFAISMAGIAVATSGIVPNNESNVKLTKLTFKKILDAYGSSVALALEASSRYLPSVAGSGHSWICVLNDIKIAEIESTGIQPLVRENQFSDENRIHFIYKSVRF